MLFERGDVTTEFVGVLHDLRVQVRTRTDLEQHATLCEPLAERRVLGGVDAVSDALGLEVLEHLVHRVPVLVLPRMHREPQAGAARLLEERGVVAILEVRVRRARDVDPDHAAVAVRDRLVDDDLVQRVAEGPIEAEDEGGAHRVLEPGAIEAADRRHDDVVEVLLAPAVALHRVVAELERGDVRLPVRAAHDLVYRFLHGQRARLDQLGPAVQREEVLERLPLLPADGDEIHELPVVLRRKTDALLGGDAPHRSGVDRAAEVDMELRELVAEWVRRS